ncbi:hypothetical protein [Actinoplanes couchii]|uniref:BMP family ABC transporter substrate-binding protein n=1 Tax=Actinoplanes couchii TaxID=403638 RepID=A0ABQ3XE89_9ACTN|nr:hypothetical protein [Actinoplanes couchii]MDR6317284.1 hypothetical protein [Actinoplanes couchii]GID56778.1 hypothetical protein Aco03nite_051820 [Actinoplanes couchii]
MHRLLLVVLMSACATLAACSGHDDWSRSRPVPAPAGALGLGFTDPSAPPTPEAVITPSPGSWSSARPAAGYRVVLLTTGTDTPTQTLTRAVREWAVMEDVSLKTVTADPAGPVDAVVAAMELRPDLIVTTGAELTEPLALVTPSHLDQQFLVLGTTIPEPTANVTAVAWTATPDSFTRSRCAAAIRAGTAAVLHDVTGVVLWLDRY